MAERNLRRALEAAKEKAGLDGGAERLSWLTSRHVIVPGRVVQRERRMDLRLDVGR